MKIYAVFDQRFPKKHAKGWDANLVPVGQVIAIDGDQALRLAKKKARCPVLFNAEDWRASVVDEKRQVEPLW